MNLVLASHGNFAKELVKSAEMIYGDMSDVPIVSLMPGMSFEGFTKEASEVLDKTGKNTLVLVDLFGGTPSNVFSALTRKYGHHVVTGLNLPMLIEVYSTMKGDASLSVEQVVKLALDTLQSSGVYVNERLGR
ncbi:PTS sugar transporter subunit IIA [Olsenella sp. Marseille-P4559]|uniref:PTS sugar transporter subunit IIA n=1 Tax=Olsenella sp. Marseille-P4559 TaxID=2364795 RepID=UPI0010300258|nr:PTS sugar transporter subunit IIA [Olsenella sp. Marseille-P4559]